MLFPTVPWGNVSKLVLFDRGILRRAIFMFAFHEVFVWLRVLHVKMFFQFKILTLYSQGCLQNLVVCAFATGSIL